MNPEIKPIAPEQAPAHVDEVEAIQTAVIHAQRGDSESALRICNAVAFEKRMQLIQILKDCA